MKIVELSKVEGIPIHLVGGNPMTVMVQREGEREADLVDVVVHKIEEERVDVVVVEAEGEGVDVDVVGIEGVRELMVLREVEVVGMYVDVVEGHRVLLEEEEVMVLQLFVAVHREEICMDRGEDMSMHRI